MDQNQIISVSRISVLFLALGIAAWLDHKQRRVPNDFWITWSKPAIFLWTLDLLNQDAQWYVYATAAGMVAYASIAVIGRPNLNDISQGNKMDIIVSMWYLFGLLGIVHGANLHGEYAIDVLNGSASEDATLWWLTVSVALPIFLVDSAWRLRLIHGGADAKCVMWVAILIPNWGAVPVYFPKESLISLPPSIALLMWGGVTFLLLPILFVIFNFMRGGGPFRLLWHAYKMDLEQAMKKHVWILTTIVDMPSGEKRIVHKTRAPSRTPTQKELENLVEELRNNNVETVWVTPKLPLLVFLWPAIIPLIIVGGPMAFIMPLFGI